MNHNDFEKEIKEVFDKCIEVLIQKGREYQNTQKDGTNVFANFERGASDLGLSREDILWVFFSKHKDSINKFLRDLKTKAISISEIEENLSEPINGRIIDAINYLLLLNSMINERRNMEKGKKLEKKIVIENNKEPQIESQQWNPPQMELPTEPPAEPISMDPPMEPVSTIDPSFLYGAGAHD